MKPVDMLFYNGSVLTMAKTADVATAIATGSGQVLAVGDDQQILAMAGAGTRMVDLQGATVMPGFVEPHGHPVLSGLMWGDPVVDIRAIHTPTFAAAMEKIRRRVRKADPGEFLFFAGLDPVLHQDLVEPTRQMLDEIAPHNPVAIQTANMHAIYVNSATVRKCGFGPETRACEGGQIVFDSGGLPWKFVESATNMVTDPFYDYTGQQRTYDELQNWLWRFARAGITTSSEIALWPSHTALYRRLLQNGPIPIRVLGYEMGTSQCNASVPLVNGDDVFRVIGIKFLADGSPFVGNVWLSRPYLNTDVTIRQMGLEENHTGEMSWEKEELLGLVRAYARQGWQIAMHVQGDRSMDVVLDIYEQVLSEIPKPRRPFRLEHCALMTEEQIARANRIGAVCSFFLPHMYHWGEAIKNDLFGPERAERYLPHGIATRSGMRVSYHCDTPMTEPNPLRLLQIATTRRTAKGNVIGLEQRVSIDEALRAVTIDAAWQMGVDDQIGSLEPGKNADLVILDADPRKANPAKLDQIQVLGTYVGGREIWSHLTERGAE